MAKLNRFEGINLDRSQLVAGRFRILECIGLGGCAMVYKCADVKLKNRIVALKVRVIRGTQNTNSAQRFEKEAIYSYEISHKNVVRIYDFINEPNLSAITMEYIEGGDLRSLIDQGRLTTPQIIHTLIQICDGVEAIHAQGILHRDLKPENILISKTGVVKIADFGVAKTPHATHLTNDGGIVGSVSYICPEYFSSGEMDHRGDLYAIGILAYELLTGSNPHEGASLVDIIQHRIKSTPKPLLRSRPDSPPALQGVIDKALMAAPEKRYQTAADMRQDLVAILAEIQAEPFSEEDLLIPTPHDCEVSATPSAFISKLRIQQAVVLASALACGVVFPLLLTVDSGFFYQSFANAVSRAIDTNSEQHSPLPQVVTEASIGDESENRVELAATPIEKNNSSLSLNLDSFSFAPEQRVQVSMFSFSEPVLRTTNELETPIQVNEGTEKLAIPAPKKAVRENREPAKTSNTRPPRRAEKKTIKRGTLEIAS